jgi:glycosyltransferase involved in cell wall biosynthesis
MRNRVISVILHFRYRVLEYLRLRIARYNNRKKNTKAGCEPLISITIPTYDRGQLLLDRTLPSIFAQTYKNFEIIIVGDFAVSDTVKILSGISDSRVRFVNLSKRTKYPDDPKLRWFISGVDPSNHGIDLANGEWICYFDDDDIMDPNYLRSLLNFAENGDFEFVAGLYEEDRNGVKSIQGWKSDKYPEFGGHSTWMYRSYLKFFKYNIHSWRKKYNRPQDIDFQIRMKQAGVRMQLFEQVVSYIRPRPGNTTIGLDARLEECEK